MLFGTITHKKDTLKGHTKKEPPPSKDGSSSRLLSYHSEPITAASARQMDALWCSSCTWGQVKAVFPSLLGVASLRLRRHAKGTCDFLIPHLHQWGTSGRYPMPFVKEGRTRPYIQCACSSTRLSQQYKKLESKRVRPYIQCACSSILPRKPKIDTSTIPVRRTWRFQ